MKIRLASIALAFALMAGIAAAFLFDGEGREFRPRALDTHVALGIDQPLPTTDVSPPIEVSSEDSTSIRDWTRRLHESTDDFALTQELADAALGGDAKAQYVLSRVVLRCEVYKRMLTPYTQGAVAERIELYLAHEGWAADRRERFTREALRCEKYFFEDPFEGYGLPEDARDFRYWAARAAESGDPVAVLDRAFRSAPGRRSGDSERDRAAREVFLGEVHQAVSSGDPAALFMVGGYFSTPSVAADPDHGLALLVAACETGYDCTVSNPDLGGAGCVDAGKCVPGYTLLDTMQRDLDPSRYAAIYADAQDIQYKIRTNDWDGLQQYLQLKE